MSDRKEAIVGKLVLSGTLNLMSPMLIGTGQDNHSDNDALVDRNGNPYIPATSIAGVISHKVGIKNQSFVNFNKNLEENIKDFWGTERDTEDGKTSGKQSDIIIYDSYLLNSKSSKPIIRDQIRMNLGLGVTEEGAKFDYEIVEPDAQFSFRIEIGYTEKRKEFIFRMFKTIEMLLKNGDISFGAKTNNGFGKVKLLNPTFYDYDFSKKENVFAWLERNTKETIQPKELKDVIRFECNVPQFTISLKALIDNSLIIGSSDSEFEADKVHIKSAGKHVLTGSSLKGAIRSRAEKILLTIGQNPKEKNWIDFFGTEGNPKEKILACKSRLSVTESFFENNPNEELQSRIKIDRFTGGTIEGALFDSMPLFQNKDNTASVTFEININDFNNTQEDKAAAGLLLLVLKDLWTGDLPIGGEKNVGRGRLQGVGATISWDIKKVILKSKDNVNNSPVVTDGNWDDLEKFVSELNKLIGVIK